MISLLLLGLTIGTFVNKNGSYKMLVATSLVGLIETTVSFPLSIMLSLTCAGMYGMYCISSEYISDHQIIETQEAETKEDGMEGEEGTESEEEEEGEEEEDGE